MLTFVRQMLFVASLRSSRCLHLLGLLMSPRAEETAQTAQPQEGG